MSRSKAIFQVLLLLISYDIACQWSKHFHDRQAKYPKELRVNPSSTTFTFAIPDMHVVGHGIKCQDTFSFQFLPGSGQTCGEGIEQGWAAHNALATSTREMTAGSRADTIEDHLGAWNWRKVVHMPRQLKTAL